MGFLGVLAAGAVGPGLLRRVFAPVVSADILPRFLHGGGGHIDAVRPHIGNQPHGAFGADVQPFVKLLGHGHGALRGKAQLAPRVLLQGAGDKGRRGTLAAGAFRYAAHGVGRALQLRFQGPGGVLVADFQLAARALAGMEGSGEQMGRRRRYVVPVQFRFQRPPFYGNKGGDFLLPFHNHTESHGLYPACGEAEFDLEPEQRTDFIAHQPVQDAPGLLRIHQLHINGAGMGECFLHRLPGDFVKDDALGRLVLPVPARGGLEMPGNGFALPVGVRSQKDVAGLVAGRFEVVHQLFLVPQGQVFGPEFRFGIYAQGGLGQVADMAH